MSKTVNKVIMKLGLTGPTRVSGRSDPKSVVATKEVTLTLTPSNFKNVVLGDIQEDGICFFFSWKTADLNANPPIFHATGRMPKGTLLYVEALRTSGWKIDQKAVKSYRFK